jgi:mannonate dehydratase
MAPYPGETAQLRLTAQTGLKFAIAWVSQILGELLRSQYAEAPAKIQAEFASYALEVARVEPYPVPAGKVTLGLEGRDEPLENCVAALQAMAEVGFPTVYWNFMAALNRIRTGTDAPERGGAPTTVFDMDAARNLPLTGWGEVSEQRIWNNITYFLRVVIPAAAR